jgi:GNAT superfamily N-acetyltransferase
MPALWRLTRNRYGRAVYDALARAGITATVMDEFVRSLGTLPDVGDDRIERCDPSTVARLDAPTGELLTDEEVLAAFEDGRAVGYLFLSVDATHRIHPLERPLSFEGAYLRRVFVAPDHRERGVASALVAAACERAQDRGADRASALVAVDNRPSRRLFERLGFSPRRRRRYARVGPLSHRSVREPT